MTDWKAYREAPAKLPGMSKFDAEKFLKANEFPFGIAVEDDKTFILPAIVMIRLTIKNGVVTEAELDGQTFANYAR